MPGACERIECDLLIIGSGMAGMAAALFAARRQIETVQIGLTGEIVFASGLLDLLGLHPVTSAAALDDPWEGIARLCRDQPAHPYALASPAVIRTAMETLIGFLNGAGLSYEHRPGRNMRVITPVGTVKTTYAVPGTMAPGAQAFSEKMPTLLVDFPGLKGYSALQIKETLAALWPELETCRVPFSDLQGDLYPERMALALQTPEHRRRLATGIAPHLGVARSVGLPAVLGVQRSREVAADLADRLGMPVFEIPTLLPGVSGLRLRETFESRLSGMGVRTLYQHRATSVRRCAGDRFCFELEPASPVRQIAARSAILATGRFFGQGLIAERAGIRESLFGLPVHQPDARSRWHRKDFLHREGHLVNRAGLAVDRRFRPLNSGGEPAFANLAAAGSVLAHQDWIREKSGSGIAAATACAAVDSMAAFLSGS